MKSTMHSRATRNTVLAVLTISTLLANPVRVQAQASQPVFRKVALSGQPAPDTAGGVTFKSFAGPRLDASDRVAFYAFLAGSGVGAVNDQGIWSESVGQLALVARTGNLASGTSSAVFSNLFLGSTNPPALGVDAAGTIRFLARIFGGDVCDCNGNGVLDNDTGWWSDAGGALALVARADSQVPGLPPGVLFDTIVGAPAVAANGTSAQLFFFKGAGVGFVNGKGIMSDASGALAMIARGGDPAPGLPAGTSFGEFSGASVGPTGATAFVASLAGAGVTQTNDDSLWAERTNGLTMLVRQGDPAPGGDVFGNPSVLGVFTNISIRSGDRLAFACLLASGGSGIFTDASGSLVSLVRAGMQAPGLPAGTQFQHFGSFVQDGPLQLSEAGHIAFMARLNSPNPSNESLWLADSTGDLRLVARGGDTPPDAPAGVTFTTNTGGFVSIFGSPALNLSGQVAFAAFLAGPGFPNFGQHGLYATDSTGTLRKVVQPGDVVDVSGAGDLRTVADVFFNKDGLSAEQYNGATFSDDGTIVFRLAFTDGSSGVFTTQISSLPPGVYCQAKVNSQGCTPAIAFGGTPTLSGADDFVVSAGQVLNNKLGMLVFGLAPAFTPFQGGTLCIAPPFQRTGFSSSGGNPPPDDCSGSHGFQFSHAFMAAHALTPGVEVFAQFITRDPGFVPPGNVGLTDALRFTVAP